MTTSTKAQVQKRAARQLNKSVRRLGDAPEITSNSQAALDHAASEYSTNNDLKNEYTKKSVAGRKDLLSLMTDLGKSTVTVTIAGGVKKVATIAASEQSKIDVFKLIKEVDEETLMKILAASNITIKAVEDFAGSIVSEKCRIIKKGNANVNLK